VLRPLALCDVKSTPRHVGVFMTALISVSRHAAYTHNIYREIKYLKDGVYKET